MILTLNERKLKLLRILLPLMTAAAASGMILMTCFASADAKSLMEMAIKIIAKLIIASGIMFFVLGLIKWANAHSDSDGPAQSRAAGMIIAGITLFALSMILTNAAPDLAANLETTI